MTDGILHIPDSSRADRLTRTEVRVLAYIASGCTHMEIATLCCRSRHTVVAHMRSIHKKVGTDRPALLAQFARITGIIPADCAVELPMKRPQTSKDWARRPGTRTPASGS